MKHYVDNYILNPVHKLTVTLIGCGGTGSQVLTSLGRMDYALRKLGHPGLAVTAYDGDIVTQANCGRQLFSVQEIGRNKAEVLVTKLNMFFGTNWQCEQRMFDKSCSLGNIVITCVDTASARLLVDDMVKKAAKRYDQYRTMYWLDFGNLAKTGQVVLGTVGKIKQPKKGVDKLPTICDLFDLRKVNDKNNGPSCSLADALSKQDLFINSTLAQIGMAIMWKMFSGVIEVHGAFVNLDTMVVSPLKVTNQL